MASPRKEGLAKGEMPEASDRPLSDDAIDESRENEGSEASGALETPRRSEGGDGGLAERPGDALRGGSDEDLVLERTDGEIGALQWLRALDLQFLGACRADERLKPLLKLNVSSGAKEDRLISQLSQHFEASEIGMLARCLCVPLVSIRVGKVNKQANLLCPTTTRGHLNLTLLPSSSMRISFAGDDGHTERLALVSNEFEDFEVIIEGISADSSGRSFQLKVSESRVLYYWCSEKSKHHGMELLEKMKDLLKRRPTLSNLTGISDSRLDSFATHLQAYLLSSSNPGEIKSIASPFDFLTTSTTDELYSHSSPLVPKSSRFRPAAAHAAKVNPVYQASLSPRSNTFKDGALRNPSGVRSGTREKLKRRGEGHIISSTIATPPISSSVSTSTHSSISNSLNVDNSLFVGLPKISCLPASLLSCNPPAESPTSTDVAAQSSLFRPYYCWCPPCPSSLQYTVTPLHQPSTSSESLPPPPLSSLLSGAHPPASGLPSKSTNETTELPPLNFQSLLHDPLAHLSLPVSSRVSLPGSQVLTFTPFMSDPIVHIPVIDVCSSGQAYLVSAGPAISSAIPPLHPTRVNPLIPEAESLAEKNARETLRRLIDSSPVLVRPQLMSVAPAASNGVDGHLFCSEGAKRDIHISSQNYGRNFNFDSIASGISLMGLYSSKDEVDGDDGDETIGEEGHECMGTPKNP
ncbi:hypothetical protein ACMD2_14946 [Ananas comosus]|uniref:Uncharacterized protein n=1 Tax=Ananas comosus TaxID=4615 RepID=A0A199UNK8_ANACO|nr:hypothetical protein ACMD2_14946 [Ananas comosus]